MPSTGGLVDSRFTLIMEAFNDAGSQGLTILEASAILDMNYHTLRKDLMMLVKYGKIAHNGRARDKSMVYTVTGKFNVPTVRVGRQFVPFHAFVDQELENAPARPINMTKILRAALMGITTRALVGNDGTLDYYPKEIRLMLTEAINRAEQFVEAAKSILDDPRYWNEQQLPDVLDVSKYELDVMLVQTRKALGEVLGMSPE